LAPSQQRNITEVTRRDIFELLSSINMYGRLSELEFLTRLYDLDALPSYDSRFKTARQDISQHTLANEDWDGDWILHDDRFALKHGPDAVLLRFLSELLHPLVRPNRQEAEQVAQQLNALLAPDGYRLVVVNQLSGRPIYGAVEVPAEQAVQPRHFTTDIRPLVATIARLAELDGSDMEREVLRSSIPRLEEPEYDNLDGGTYYYTLKLIVPVELFARIGNQIRPLEEQIIKRISVVLRGPDQHHITGIVIQPSLEDAQSPELIRAVVGSARELPAFWSPGQFRLFISHVTSFKQRATALRQELTRFHISGFVAHETIDPGKLWQREIEAALGSMHGLVALITPDFHASNWTDQEIGWALGAGMYVLPVRRGADPYGFLGQIQGIQGMGKSVPQVASEVFLTLLREPLTKPALVEALVAAFEQSPSYASARENMRLLEQVSSISEQFLRRIETAAATNDQVSESFGIKDRIEALRRKATIPR
jgi:hypothetical protein